MFCIKNNNGCNTHKFHIKFDPKKMKLPSSIINDDIKEKLLDYWRTTCPKSVVWNMSLHSTGHLINYNQVAYLIDSQQQSRKTSANKSDADNLIEYIRSKPNMAYSFLFHHQSSNLISDKKNYWINRNKFWIMKRQDYKKKFIMIQMHWWLMYQNYLM